MELVGRYFPGGEPFSAEGGGGGSLSIGPLFLETHESPSPMRLYGTESGALFSPTDMDPGTGPRLSFSLSPERALKVEPDHLGRADLYYKEEGGGLSFSTRPGFIADKKVFDPDALLGYLLFGHVPSPRTCFGDLKILPGGHTLTAHGQEVSIARGQEMYQNGPGGGFDLAAAVKGEVSRALDTFSGPLGLFLSAGIDSAGLLSIVREATDRRIYTYTVSAGEKEPEARAARELSAYFGTVHRDIVATADIFSRASKVMASLDGPFGNPSALLVDLALNRAAQEVDLVLSGLGADELFSGHGKHRILWAFRLFPGPLRRVMGLLGALTGLLPPSFVGPGAFRLARFAAAAGRYGEGRAYPWLYSIAYPLWAKRWGVDAALGFCPGGGERYEDADIRLWLMDGPLRFTSRLASARGLIMAFPLASEPVLRYALSLPLADKVNLWSTKLPVRRALAKRVPGRLLGRPGRGFVMPRALWRGAAGLFNETLSEPSETLSGAVGRKSIERLLSAYERGSESLFPFLYSLFALEAWLKNEAG